MFLGLFCDQYCKYVTLIAEKSTFWPIWDNFDSSFNKLFSPTNRG